MSATVPQYVTTKCPHCGAKARAHAQHAGRTARCKRCDASFRIPELEQVAAAEEAVEARREAVKKTAAEPLVGVSCRVCQTRMSVPVRHVGRKVKCPDCGTATVIPPPEAPRKRNVPSAFVGEQYEVYEEENQPWAADLIAEQPKLLPVVCGHCQTLMHAAADQVGQPVTCPDCGVQTIVTKEQSREKQEVLVEGYDVAPPEVEDTMPAAARAYIEEAEAEAAAAVARETVERPELPRYPLLIGVWGYLRSEGMLAKHVGFALALSVIGLMLADGVPAMMAFQRGAPILINAAAFMGVGEIILAVCFGILWTGAFAVVALGLVTESSEGNAQYHGTLSANPTDWFPEGVHLVMAVGAAVAPGWAIAMAAPIAIEFKAIVLAASVVLLLPIAILSQLDLGSPFALISPRLLASLGKVAGSWILLMLHSTAIAAGVLACAALIALFRGWAVVPVTPILVGLGLLYFRLLGRLAWIIAERSEAMDNDDPGAN